MATLLNQNDEYDEIASARIQLCYQHMLSLFCPLLCYIPTIDSTTTIAVNGMEVMGCDDLMYEVSVVAFEVAAAAIVTEKGFENLTMMGAVAVADDDDAEYDREILWCLYYAIDRSLGYEAILSLPFYQSGSRAKYVLLKDASKEIASTRVLASSQFQGWLVSGSIYALPSCIKNKNKKGSK